MQSTITAVLRDCVRRHRFVDTCSWGPAVLYNFEQVPRGLPRESACPGSTQPEGQHGSLISSRTLRIYASYTLWDYSEDNVKQLIDVGIHADLVPLGFSAKFAPSFGFNQKAGREDEETIDVLFIGAETPSRKETVRRLREAGITVFHPNSDGIHLYGAKFDAVSSRSKIVLNLNAFKNDANECSNNDRDGTRDGYDAACSAGEWKMPRLARLLANRR